MNENILSYKNGAIQFFIFTFLSFYPFFTHFSITQIYIYIYFSNHHVTLLSFFQN